MSETDHTFQIDAGGKARYNAGTYCEKTQSPKYELEISAPSHVRNQIEVSQFLMGTEGSRIWVWEIINNSTWPVFCLVKKDGQLVQKQCAS